MEIDPLIPQSAGATPFGIFQLAEAFRQAATATMSARTLTSGPTRLLAYHACELYLKAFLRQQGQGVEELRSYGHDLDAMLIAASERGLAHPPQLASQLKKAALKNDYVRVRYMVTEDSTDIRPGAALRLVEVVRESVRLGLEYDDLGMPKRRQSRRGKRTTQIGL